VYTEEFGVGRGVRHPDWSDGLIKAVNLGSRVYSQWVNGTDTFFYRGSAQALNEAIRKYAVVKGDVRHIVLAAGPGKTQTQSGKPVDFDWQVQVPGGMDRAGFGKKDAVMTVYISAIKPRPLAPQHIEKWLKDLDSDLFPARAAADEALQKLGNDVKPMLRSALLAQTTLETRRRIQSLLDRLPGIDLTDLEIPKGIVVIGVDDLIAKGLQELKAPDRNVRSMAIQELSGLARFSDKVVPALVEIFEKDKDAHIRQVAALCLARAGTLAKSASPALKRGLDDPDANIRQTCQNTLQHLVNAEDTPEQQERLSHERAILRETIEFKKAAGLNKLGQGAKDNSSAKATIDDFDKDGFPDVIVTPGTV
jgi:hypothetical protein